MVAKKYGAVVSSAPPSALTVDDLDDLVADLEHQEGRRRLPPTGGLQVVGARKTTSRKTVKGALDGDDLDRIVDEINQHARRSIQQSGAADQLGFGVINAERKFDLRAPKTALEGTTVECTLYVYTQSGEKSRIPTKHLSARVSGAPLELVDQKDGTYTIKFKAAHPGQLTLELDSYGKQQFAWPIEIIAAPSAPHCTAAAVEPLVVGRPCTVLITARDKTGTQLKVGGAQFNLGFAGAGQLSEVGLLDRLDGTYALQFVPDTAGQYAIFISLDNVEIATHPVEFTVKA